MGRDGGEDFECLFDALPPIHFVKVAVVCGGFGSRATEETFRTSDRPNDGYAIEAE